MKVVHIHKEDTMDEIDVTGVHELIDRAKSQGDGLFQCLYVWKYEGYLIQCYGWYDGEPGFETKHELPPGGGSKFLTEDSSSQMLFGDLFLVKMDLDGALANFDVSEYGEFYHVSSGGCSDISDSEDEEEEHVTTEEESEDDEEEEEELLFEPSEPYQGELEEDTHEYKI